MRRRLLQLVITTLLTGVALFASAGTLRWLRGWIYFGIGVAIVVVSAIVLIRKNPALIQARGEIHRDAKAFDKVILRIYVVLLFAPLVVAGLDAVRYRWSSLPPATLYWGVALQVLSILPALWAMMENPFAEPVVRIQKERGHVAITKGPYRFVRHPMYVGVILGAFAVPLVLGSAWAFVPAFVTAILFVVRTALEDRTLRSELPGYDDYAQHTRYRLLPGVW
jgi:protein-S-isoprenylcysteine O-methyltransferase Ste14